MMSIDMDRLAAPVPIGLSNVRAKIPTQEKRPFLRINFISGREGDGDVPL